MTDQPKEERSEKTRRQWLEVIDRWEKMIAKRSADPEFPSEKLDEIKEEFKKWEVFKERIENGYTPPNPPIRGYRRSTDGKSWRPMTEEEADETDRILLDPDTLVTTEPTDEDEYLAGEEKEEDLFKEGDVGDYLDDYFDPNKPLPPGIKIDPLPGEEAKLSPSKAKALIEKAERASQKLKDKKKLPRYVYPLGLLLALLPTSHPLVGLAWVFVIFLPMLGHPRYFNGNFKENRFYEIHRYANHPIAKNKEQAIEICNSEIAKEIAEGLTNEGAIVEVISSKCFHAGTTKHLFSKSLNLEPGEICSVNGSIKTLEERLIPDSLSVGDPNWNKPKVKTIPNQGGIFYECRKPDALRNRNWWSPKFGLKIVD